MVMQEDAAKSLQQMPGGDPAVLTADENGPGSSSAAPGTSEPEYAACTGPNLMGMLLPKWSILGHVALDLSMAGAYTYTTLVPSAGLLWSALSCCEGS